MSIPADRFPDDPGALPPARAPDVLDLGPGAHIELTITPVAKVLGEHTVRMLSYNGSVPGPTLRVQQGSTVRVTAINSGDLHTTIHWHGLRLDNRYDGTTATQQPIPVGGRFTYELTFPDPGVYWYHPHIREDYTQELGLYGNILVVPSDRAYWAPVNRELALTLDDVLIEDGRIAPFSRVETNHVAMGRFGNVLLVNGEPRFSMTARRGEVVRLYLTNTANTRVFSVGVPCARMKLVGGDSGRVEHESFVDSVIIAPSERAIVDVLFDEPGALAIEHRTPHRIYSLGTITVVDDSVGESFAAAFEERRQDPDLVAERARLATVLNAPPHKTLRLVAEMNLGEPEAPQGAVLVWTCPMHPDVVRNEQGKCPACGMKLLATAQTSPAYACPMHPDVRGGPSDRCPKCGMKLVPAHLVPGAPHDPGHPGAPSADEPHPHDAHDAHGDGGGTKGIEWEDDMVEVNRLTTPANTKWRLVDADTGNSGKAIDWRFRVGDRVRIRVVNTMDSDHPMHHPFHIHGAGRFLVLARDGIDEANLVWKDTVLVPMGQTVDLLLEVTNPGLWMAHCHIAEHHEGGMHLNFTVDP